MKWTTFFENPARWFRWTLAVMLCVLCAGTFARVAGSQFVAFDDDIEITKNPHIQGLGASNLAWMFTDVQQTQRYTPLAWGVWAAIYHVWVLNPAPFHVVGLVLHVCNTLLVYLLLMRILRKLFARDPPERRTANACFAALGASLWALHPLRVEVVGWATQVRFAEATFFALLCVLAYFEAAQQQPQRPWRSGWYWMSVAAFAVSLLFYPSGVGVVIVLMAADIIPLRRVSPQTPSFRKIGRLFAEKIPFIAPALFVAAMTIYGRFATQGIFHGPARMETFGLESRTMQALYIVTYYLWKPLVPFHVSPVYTQLVSFHPMAWPFVLSALSVVVITAAAVMLWRRLPGVMLLWISHVALVLPFGGYFEHPHYPSDRYSYLQGIVGSVAVAVVFGWLWHEGKRMAVRVGMAAGIGAIALFAVLSSLQTRIWQDSASLFTSIIAALGDDPYRADIQWRLASVYVDDNRPAEALPLLQSSLHIDPINIHALATLEKTCELLVKTHESDKRTLYRQVAEAYDHQAAIIQQIAPLRVAAKYYDLAGDPNTAADRLETVISLETDDTQDRLELTRIQHEPHAATTP
jgi:hypothetical protein